MQGMSFSIRFLPRATEEFWEGQRIKAGRITLGDFSEQFMSFLDYWSPLEYEAQWRCAVQRIVSGACIEALITDMHDLTTAHHLVSWPMYREGSQVFIQNRLLLLKDLGRPLKLDHLFAKLGDRRTLSGDGAKLSEWSVAIRDLEIFLSQPG